jgi:hypothetical protein
MPYPNLLSVDSPINSLFREAWKLDAAFHGFSGSGAGVFASIVGTENATPVLYYTEARKIWNGDVGTTPWQLAEPGQFQEAHQRIDALKCYGFVLSHGQDSDQSVLQRGHFALVHTGHPKSTGFAMKKVAEGLGGYFTNRADMIQSLVRAFREEGGSLRYPLSQRASEDYRSLVDSVARGGEDMKQAQDQHKLAIREVMLAAYGCSALCGLNSYWSGVDATFLRYMKACQSVLEGLGLGYIQPEGGVISYEPSLLAAGLQMAHNEQGEPLFGVKLTGGGTGGDLIICSGIKDAQVFEKALRRAIGHIRDLTNSEYEDYARVHFSSTWLEGSQSGYQAQPVCSLR